MVRQSAGDREITALAWYNPFKRKRDEQVVELDYGFLTPEADDPGMAISTGHKRLARIDNLPRFRGSANQNRQSGNLRSSLRSKVSDTFTPTQPVDDIRLFAGREQVLRNLIRSIEDQRLHVVVYGDRGMGKTSLLHIFAQVAQEADYHVCYHSCGQSETFTEMCRAVAAGIPALYDRRYDPTSSAIEQRQTLGDLLPPGELGVGQVSDAFSHIDNTRVLIILDEFDRSVDADFRRNIAELIKNLSDRSIRVQLVLAGVAANLAELIGYIPSIRRNIHGLQVAGMSPDEVQELIRIGQRATGLVFGDPAIARIVHAAHGSPYLASMLGQYAAFAAVDRGAATVSEDDVDEAIDLAVTELRQRVTERSLSSIDHAFAAGYRDMLIDLARDALGALGRVDVMGEQEAAQIRSLLVERHAILAPVPDEARRFWFVEESVPTYLSLLSTKRQSTGQPR